MTPHSDYRTIDIKRGLHTIVDAADYDWLCETDWYSLWSRSSHCYYVSAAVPHNGKITTLSMHRFIMGIPFHDPRQVDHINGNTLDNRRQNLRICTPAENTRNAKRRSDNASGYKGVYKHKDGVGWIAQITFEKVQRYLGYYRSKEEANSVVRKARQELHGEFARYE